MASYGRREEAPKIVWVIAVPTNFKAPPILANVKPTTHLRSHRLLVSCFVRVEHLSERPVWAVHPASGIMDFCSGETGLPVSIADDPLASVVLGAGALLSDFKLLRRMSIE